MKKLFEPARIGTMELKNRILMLPMHTLFSKDNHLTQRDVAFYQKRMEGGVAAIIGVGYVTRRGGQKDMLSLAEDSFIPEGQRLADLAHSYDCKFIMQLFHCGRNGNPDTLAGMQPQSASRVPSSIYRGDPEEMSLEDIRQVVLSFGEAAERCKKAGMDGVEINCTVGYLLTCFLSPITNLRTDEYGGSDENRMRLSMEVMREVRRVVGKDYPVILRVSGSQMMPGGYGMDLTQKLCQQACAEKLIDAINVTGGWHESPVPGVSYQVPKGTAAFMTADIKQVVDVPVICGNRVNDRETAERILSTGMADFIGAARPFLADPAFVNKMQAGVPYNICQACNKCLSRTIKNIEVACAFNPSLGREWEEADMKPLHKRILVIGSGPAGFMAAKMAALRGCNVSLCTKESELGGRLKAAAKPPQKQDIERYLENIAYELEQLGVHIILNMEADAAFIAAQKPDHVFVATGGVPVVPSFPGLEEQKVFLAEDVLCAPEDLTVELRKGPLVIVGGGSIGIETALYIANKGFINESAFNFMRLSMTGDLPPVHHPADITLVEMSKRMGMDLGGLRRVMLDELKDLGIKTKVNTKVTALTGSSVLAQTPEGDVELPAAHVILALGYRPAQPTFLQELDAQGIAYTVIGDAGAVGDAMHAHQDAYNAVMSL